MKKFIVTVRRTELEKWYVEAEDAEQAKDLYYEGDAMDSNVISCDPCGCEELS